ncbi:MAG TPA: class I SAM-dependent methyltransferase [Gemmatimonadaceae bacterium]|jgi:methyltransferase (TIGR00027 family)
MADRNASLTARGVAGLRAAHQLIDAKPPILDDPVIVKLLGPEIEARIRAEAERNDPPLARGLRSHVVLRSRFAEDALHNAVARGVRQYVLLGAGLDTFAYRQPEWAHGLAIVEVDQPASQSEKRRLLESAGVSIPSNVRFADVDFEKETLAEGLHRADVDFTQPTLFSWLGVTMYLTREAIDAVLATVASFAKGSEIVLTFAQPPDPDDPSGRFFAERAAMLGEPWLSYFATGEIEGILRAHGFSDVQFLTREAAIRQYYEGRSDDLLPPRRVSIVSATV